MKKYFYPLILVACLLFMVGTILLDNKIVATYNAVCFKSDTVLFDGVVIKTGIGKLKMAVNREPFFVNQIPDVTCEFVEIK